MIVSVAWQAILEAGSTGDGPGWACAVVRAKFRKVYAIASDSLFHATFPKRADQCFDYDNCKT